MVSVKRMIAQGIARGIVFVIMTVFVPSYLSIKFYYFMLSIGADKFTLAFNSAGFAILMVFLFLFILGLAVED